MKKRANIVLKICFSLIVLAVLFREVHPSELLAYLKITRFDILMLAPLLMFITCLLAAYRWLLVMTTLKFPRHATFYIETYLKATLFNQILPTSIGGDAYRVLEIKKLGHSVRSSINSVLADRIFGFAGLIIINIVLLPYTYHILPRLDFYMIFCTTLLCTGGLIGLCLLPFIRIFVLQKYLGWFYALSNTLLSSFSSTADFMKKFILAFLSNFLTVFIFYVIARSLNVHVNLIDFMVIIPSVMLLLMVRISMAGWGIREGALVFLGAAIGIAKPAALTISLLYGVVLIVSSLPGFYLYFCRPAPKEALTN